MKLDVFDKWRETYSKLTYSQQQDYARWLYENYPDQSYFGCAFKECVIGLCEKEKLLKVMEFGGWDGELASVVLKDDTQIELWDNFEICPTVPSVCKDVRYRHCEANDFVWNLGQSLDYDLFVSSHALEHLSTDDLRLLLNKVRHIPYLAFQLPFSESGSWAGTTCFHILELSPAEFIKTISSFGYTLEHTGISSEEQRFFFRRVSV